MSKRKFVLIAREISELKVEVNPKTEDNLSALKGILCPKTGQTRHISLKSLLGPRKSPVRNLIPSKSPAVESDFLEESEARPKRGRKPIVAAVNHSLTLRDGMQRTYVSPDGRRRGKDDGWTGTID